MGSKLPSAETGQFASKRSAAVADTRIPILVVTNTTTPSSTHAQDFLQGGSQFSGTCAHAEFIVEGDESLRVQDQPPQVTTSWTQEETKDIIDAAIRTPGPTGPHIPRTVRPLPSVISDLGDSLLPPDQTTFSEPLKHDTLPSTLYKGLHKAIVRVPCSHGNDQFLPNTEIFTLITPDSVARELGRSMRPRTGKSNPPPIFRSTPQADPEEPPARSSLLQVPTPSHFMQQTLPRVVDWSSGMIMREKLAKKICGVKGHTPDGAPDRETEDPTSLQGPRTYHKIFAVLVLLEKSLQIRRFIKEKVTDRDLPLTLRLSDGRMFRRADKSESRPLACFKGWSLPAKKRFEQVQWGVKAPYFRQGSEDRPVLHFSFSRNVILPLTFNQNVGEGAHGVVFKVHIHEGHHGFGGPDRPFALKRLKGNSIEALRREAMVPKLLSRRTHTHILPLLATIEQDGEYSLLFDSAETSLAQYWNSAPTPASTREATMWLARECTGIARGLAHIHGPHMVAIRDLAHIDSFKDRLVVLTRNSQAPKLCEQFAPRHGDLKAENLLLFPSPGTSEGSPDRDSVHKYTIKISDFGLAGCDPIHNPRDRIPGPYAPPETETHPVIHGNLCDVWSLGCLYLEFIIWYFGGKVLLDDFAKARKQEPTSTGRFFETFDADGVQHVQLKACVGEFIQSLYNNTRCTQYFADFLKLIEGGMLVVDDGNTPDSVRSQGYQGSSTQGQDVPRQNCREVARRLGEMYDRCLKDTDYAFKSLNPNGA